MSSPEVPPTPRILVEGGPWQRRVNYILAALVGFTIGFSGGLVYTLVRLSDVSHRNCISDTTIAKIQHRQIAGQQQLTDGLIRSGLTFGLPPDKLQKAVAQGKVISAQFLRELDELGQSNC